MIIGKRKSFVKSYSRLPKHIQKKVDKQIENLERDFFYPSLRTKRMRGLEDIWEFRVNHHYRFTGQKTDNEIILRTVGPHDEGLGKR